MIEDFMNVLGQSGVDRVTDFAGVVSGISFDLYGCIQVAVTPKTLPGDKYETGHWFDHKRFKQDVTLERVMPLPNYPRNLTVYFDALGKKGADRVTGYEGIVTSLSFEISGQVGVAITPVLVQEDGESKKYKLGTWIDYERIKILDHTRVMEAPNFAQTKVGREQGAADKPAPR